MVACVSVYSDIRNYSLKGISGSSSISSFELEPQIGENQCGPVTNSILYA